MLRWSWKEALAFHTPIAVCIGYKVPKLGFNRPWDPEHPSMTMSTEMVVSSIENVFAKLLYKSMIPSFDFPRFSPPERCQTYS